MRLRPKPNAAFPTQGPNPFAKIGEIQHRSPDDLRPYERSLRRHSEKQLTKLTASINEFGFLVPVLISAEGEIIAGEARLTVAKRLGLETIPVIIADHLTAVQRRKLRLADNRLPELAIWDPQALVIELQEIIGIDDSSIELMGWGTAEIDVLLSGAGVADNTGTSSDPADEPIAVKADPVTRPGEIWVLGRHRLLCDSCLNGDAWGILLGGELGAMVFTDAPFNVRVSGHVCGLGKIRHPEFAMASGEMTRSAFTDFLDHSLGNMVSHLRDGAVVDACMDWRHLTELLTAIEAVGLSLLNLCVWNKTNGGMGSLYRSKHELVLICKKGSAPHINNVELGKHGRYRTNVWDYAGVNSFGPERMADLADHPTVKPIALVADAIRDVTRHGDIVLDGFCGSGTTLLACERTGRRGRGIEIEPRYIDVAIRRWQAMTGGQAILQSTGQTFDEVMRERLGDLPSAHDMAAE